jgi:hypothetical protein
MAYDEKVPLRDALTALRRQLKLAAEDAQKLGADDVRFRVSEIELELTVVAEDSTTAGAEVGWWIFKGNAGIAAKDAVTHKVKLNLNVGDLEVASETETR